MKLSKEQIRALEVVAAGKVWDEEKKKNLYFMLPASGRAPSLSLKSCRLSRETVRLSCVMVLNGGFHLRTRGAKHLKRRKVKPMELKVSCRVKNDDLLNVAFGEMTVEPTQRCHFLISSRACFPIFVN